MALEVRLFFILIRKKQAKLFEEAGFGGYFGIQGIHITLQIWTRV